MIHPYLVATACMIADILTKATDKKTFVSLQGYMLNDPELIERAKNSERKNATAEKARWLATKVREMF